MLNRMALDGAAGPVPVHCPASAVPRLSLLTDFAQQPPVRLAPGERARRRAVRAGRGLDAVDRSAGPPGARGGLPARRGRRRADAARRGWPRRGHRSRRRPGCSATARCAASRLAEVSAPRPGQRVAFVHGHPALRGRGAARRGRRPAGLRGDLPGPRRGAGRRAPAPDRPPGGAAGPSRRERAGWCCCTSRSATPTSRSSRPRRAPSTTTSSWPATSTSCPSAARR